MIKLWGSFKGGFQLILNGSFIISVLLIVAAVSLTLAGYDQAGATTAIVAGVGAVVSYWFRAKDGGKSDENQSKSKR